MVAEALELRAGAGRTRRQHLALFAPAAAGAALSAACGGAAPAAGQPPKPLDKTQKDELTWVVWSSDGGTRKEAHDAMVKRFAEQFPNVTVTRIAGGADTLPKLITMLASDTRVDVVGTRPDYMAAYMEGPKPLQSLSAFTKRDSSVIKEKDHVEGVVDGLSWKGTLYALPVGVYTNNVALNLDLFQQKAIPLPKESWTVEEMIDAATRLTERKEAEADSVWGFYQMYHAVTHFAYSWIRGNGGEPMTPNDEIQQSRWASDPETLNTVQWLADLSGKLRLMSVGTAPGGVWGTFREGKVAIAVMETNNLYQVVQAQAEGGARFKWDVHPLPRMKKGTYQPIGAFAYGISRNTRNPDVTWELLKEVVGPAGQTDWFRLAKFAPSLKPLLNGAYLQDREPPDNKKAIVAAIQAAKPMPRATQWVEMDKVCVENLGAIREGKVGVREALQDIDRRVASLVVKSA
ncbi:MAG TPA: extracellular solute-binding protein [Chloroflexota bacterium]|nr:extracellular solute-binding protein [Chloroflexota bacterium]